MKEILTDIPSKYLIADLEGADLIGFFSNHPVIFWVVLTVMMIVGGIYGTVYLAKKAEKNKQNIEKIKN